MGIFRPQQVTYDYGHIRLGGQLGEHPTVLIGSIFHTGHQIVSDHVHGVFDKRKAEHLINLQSEMSDRTGNPCMVDVVGETSEALIKYLDFVSEIADTPLLLNGSTWQVRARAANHIREIGLEERAIYNSINYKINDEEVDAIRTSGIKSAIIQGFHPRNPLPKGMLQILTKSQKADTKGNGLINQAYHAGIEKPLLFTPVFDVPSIGVASSAISLLKQHLGLPTGTAPVGVIGRWQGIDKLGRLAKRDCRIGATTLAQAMGADFLIYGSLAKARNIFPACAMIDAVLAYTARIQGRLQIRTKHPFYKIFQG